MKPCGADVDTGLVEALRRNDADAAERLVERFGDRAYQLALRITRLGPDAEQAVEDGLLTAVGSIHTFTGESTLESWIVRIVASAAYETLCHRRQGMNGIDLADVMPLLDGDGRHFEPMDDWSSRIDELVMQGELAGILTESIGALPAEHRTTLLLHDVEGMSKPDIAAILGTDVAAVTRCLHRARLFVRKWLSAYFESAGVG
jgi:RNA polymerase sigma-70 factor (ECF subfamily)